MLANGIFTFYAIRCQNIPKLTHLMVGFMNHFKKTINMGVIMSIFGVMSAYAEPTPLMNKKQLVGCYERINFSPEFTKQINPVEYWQQPYQWFCFKRDGTFVSVMSSHYQKHTNRSLTRSEPPLSRYDFLSKGVIKIEGESMTDESYWQISSLNQGMTTSDGTVIPKNALLMGLVDPKRGTIVYWRYLQKI